MSSAGRRFLSVPDFIEANVISSGSQVPCGIICKFRSFVSDITSHVKPSSSKVVSNINTLVNWDSFVLINGLAEYVRVEFKHGYVYPTSYSLKGYNGSYCFTKEWYLYGFNEENEEKTLLSVNKSAGSTFCSTSSLCENDNWATFSIKPVQKAFKYFRIVSKAPSCNSFWWILLSGFEIFGNYSYNRRAPAKSPKPNMSCAILDRASRSLFR